MSARPVKIAIALALLLLTFFAVDFLELAAALAQITIEIAVALLLLAFVMIYLSAVKWRIILLGLSENPDRSEIAAVSTLSLFKLYLVGYFVNLIFPSYVGGDVVRSVQLGKRVGQVRALAATVFERYTGLVAMVILAFCFVWFVQGVTPQIVALTCLITLGVVLGTALALFPVSAALLNRLPFGLGPRLTGPVQKLQKSFHLVRKDRSVVIWSLLLSFLYHSFTVLNTVLAGIAVGWTDPAILDLFVVVPIILLISAVPISPQGLGIQEGAFYFFLQMAGATPAQALGVALVLRAKSYVLALIGGLIWVLDRKPGGPATAVMS